MWPPRTYNEVLAMPGYGELSTEAKTKLRDDWVNDRTRAANSSDPSIKKRFMEEAYADVNKPSFLSKAVETGGDVLGRAGRILNTPQQILSGVWNKRAADWGVGESLGSTFKEAGEDILRDITPWKKSRTERYPYHFYTDPMVLASVPGAMKWLGGKAIKHIPTFKKGAEAVAEKVSNWTAKKPPMQGGFEPVGLGTERVAKPIVGELKEAGELGKANIPPLSTVGKPKPATPTFGEPWTKGDFPLKKAALQRDWQQVYNQTMPQLTRHFPREEAQKVAEFVARNPDDIVSQFIKAGGNLEWSVSKLSPDIKWVDVIGERLLGRPIPRADNILFSAGGVKPPIKKGPAGTPPPKATATKPPAQQPPSNVVEQINDISGLEPELQAEYLRKLLIPAE